MSRRAREVGGVPALPTPHHCPLTAHCGPLSSCWVPPGLDGGRLGTFPGPIAGPSAPPSACGTLACLLAIGVPSLPLALAPCEPLLVLAWLGPRAPGT